MKKNIDIEAAREISGNLEGTLDLLATLHAEIAAREACGSGAGALAATFAMLHGQAERLAELLGDD